MRLRTAYIIFILSIVLQACSNQSVYDALKSSQHSECQKQLTQSEYENCIEKLSPSYAEYERERRRFLEIEDADK